MPLRAEQLAAALSAIVMRIMRARYRVSFEFTVSRFIAAWRVTLDIEPVIDRSISPFVHSLTTTFEREISRRDQGFYFPLIFQGSTDNPFRARFQTERTFIYMIMQECPLFIRTGHHTGMHLANLANTHARSSARVPITNGFPSLDRRISRVILK